MAPNGPAVERKIRACLQDLDAMSHVFRKLVRMLDRSYPSARELGALIATDQSLSVRVLRMVNSASYGVRSPVLSVQQAVNLLGINTVRSLTVCLASYDSFFSGSDQERTQLWRHGLACGLFSKGLAELLQVKGADEMFAAGMLHDVGRSVLAKHYPRECRMLSCRKPGESLLEAEKRILGATHPEAGFWACQAWRLPESLQACVRFHHEPQQAGEYRLQASIVHLGDVLALQAFDPNDSELEMAHFELLDELQLTPEKLLLVSNDGMRQLADLEAFVSGSERKSPSVRAS